MKPIVGGIYPTMITPFRDGKIDEPAVCALVEWYIQQGCNGVFAVCQSSEMAYLSLEERVRLAKLVVDASAGRLIVVASGHVGNNLDEQAAEINAISATGIDGFVLVSNRLDPHQDGDDVWIANAQALLNRISPDIPLGIYECPKPYKRLLTPKILDWCLTTGRFQFIKDTCCDPDLLESRGKQLADTGCLLFNANAQTLLHSLRHGGAGYSGIMANFHPDLLAWMMNHADDPRADQLSNLLSMMAFTEGPAYPCTAKRYLREYEGLAIRDESRSADPKSLTSYQKLVLKQMAQLHAELRKTFC